MDWNIISLNQPIVKKSAEYKKNKRKSNTLKHLFKIQITVIIVTLHYL